MKRAICLMLALAALALIFSGCAAYPSSVIKEDSVREDLPEIDPEAGAANEIQVRLFYRLTDEAYLVGAVTNITVLSNERTEKTIIGRLVSGVPPLAGNISEVIPEGTEILDVTQDGAIMYITLSGELLSTLNVDRAADESKPYLDNELITQEEYYRRIAAATAEMYTVRRLAVTSIVNTVTDYDPDMRVQILVDTDGDGTGERVSRSDLGFERISGSDSNLMEPMEFDSSAIATAEAIAASALERMKNREYDKAYGLFAETESGGVQKPAYADFETALMGAGALVSYELHGSETDEDAGYAYVRADITIERTDGTAETLENITLTLRSEGIIYKMGYGAFMALIGG